MTELTQEEQAQSYHTMRHIERVRNLLNQAVTQLLLRGEKHDQSKMQPPEVALFAKYTPQLAKLKYPSPEYTESLENLGPALEHHYANNRHHPEFHVTDKTWMQIPGFSKYEISNYGDVKNKKGHILNSYVTPKGYLRLQITSDDKEKKNIFIHTLVANSFVNHKSDSKNQVNHIDGHKTNNYYKNLEWSTPSENLQHAYDTGLREGAIKYVVECPELDLLTFGCLKMERKLIDLGYSKAMSSAIWNCINHGGKHLDLEFIGTKFESWMNSPVNNMNLIDLLEMFLDWKASSENQNDGNLKKSIESGANRFGISPQLAKILENSIDLFV